MITELPSAESSSSPKPFQKLNRAAYVNFLHAKYEMYTGRVAVASSPYYLIIDPCDACQLRCTTCPTGIENERRRSKSKMSRFREKRSAMSADLLDALLEELGENLFLILFFNFGEPLLNKNLPDYIRKAKTFDIETEVHTHLSLALSDQAIEDLVSSGLDNLNASIDGFSQETYQIHRVGGDLELVKKNLEKLAIARERLSQDLCITYNFLVFAFNEHEIPAAEKYCRDLGIKFNPRAAFIDDPAWLPIDRLGEKPWSVPEEVRLRDELSIGWAPPLPLPEPSRWPASCAWHYGYSVVQPGGQVAPCDAASKQIHDMGTVTPGKTTFREVWNNDSYRRARSHFAGQTIEELQHVEPLCVRCPWPKFMRQLFSLNDAKVMLQFHRVFQAEEPVLAQAFDLLSRVRYGLPIEALCERGEIYPLGELFVGHENAADTANFVGFFEDSVASFL